MTASPGTARRYEAVVAVGVGDWSQPATLQRLAGLCAMGTTVAIIGGHRTSDAADKLRGFDAGAGTLLVAGTADSSCLIIDRSGTRVTERRHDADDDRGSMPGGEDPTGQWVMAELWSRGIGVRDVLFVFGGDEISWDRHERTLASHHVGVAIASAGLDSTVADQRARRRRHEPPQLLPEPAWAITRDRLDQDLSSVDASLFALADGLVGIGGAPLAPQQSIGQWVVTGNVYLGDGPETHLLTAPIAMQLPYEVSAEPQLRRVLDLHTGVLLEEVTTGSGVLRSVRFSSLARPGTVVFRAHCPGVVPDHTALLPSADDATLDQGVDRDAVWMRVAGDPGGVVAAATDTVRSHEGDDIIDRVAVYRPSADEVPPAGAAIGRLRDDTRTGFDALLSEHRAAWAARWRDADVVIEGEDDLQRATRFSLFHLMASAPDDGEAAVGARGQTGTGYRGHVFWDADTFTLPFLAATHPAAARAMLEYRVRRLPAARAIALDLGRKGARFPWESAHSGRDVTPISVRGPTGRIVPIRTGQLEEHIVGEVAWAASCYVDWTGDQTFARGPGLDLMVETARYWASRVRREADGAHIYGVIGPDEYHEPVDDNAFTNVMARWNLRRAADAVAHAGETGVAPAETARWRTIADELIDGFDLETGLYEQFAGFYKLEPLIITEVAPRRPIAADVLLGMKRVQGAQVIKQADVLMLHHLVPGAVAEGTLEPNLRFYEPRTAHGSSLSPGIHAALFARAREYDRALDALRIACRLDLDDLTGTTSGGLHLATMGTVWQALTFGFAGIRPRNGRLCVDPRLPPAWPALEVHVRFHGHRVHIRVQRDRLTVGCDGPLAMTAEGTDYQVDGRSLVLDRRSGAWEKTG